MHSAISISAITVTVLFALFFSRKNGSDASILPLSTVLLLTAALEFFDLQAFNNSERLYFWKTFSLPAEALLAPVWLWFSLTYARQQSEPHTISLPQRILLVASSILAGASLVLPAGSFFYAPQITSKNILFLSNAGLGFYFMLLVYMVITLINLEATFVHAPYPSRWKIKFELLGAGAVVAIFAIYYSQSFLFGTINMKLLPARSLVLIVAVFMMTYSRLKRGNGVNIRISQQMACRSIVLLAVGIYFFGFGIAGEGMKHIGNGFQQAMMFAVFFLSGLGFFVILLSETIKRRVIIFIHKNFYQNKYDYQTQWLQFTNRLSSSQTGDKLLRSIVSEFCETFGMRSGALFTLNQERDAYRQSCGVEMDADDVAFIIDDPSIEAMIKNRWIVDVRNNISMTEKDRHRDFFKDKAASFIIPLFMNDGVDGFILLGSQLNSDEIYNYEDFDLMRTLAKQASSAIMNLRLSEQLASSRELAAIGKVSAFVMHDLKNLVSSVSLMHENAQEHISVPAFQNDMLKSLGNTLIKMKALISRLQDLPEKHALQLAPVDLLQIAHETAALLNNGIKLEITGTRVIAEADKEELQKVVLNLVLNAVEASDAGRVVRLEVGGNETPYFRIKDEGCGISESFIKHVLFTPFKTTKKAGLGIGLYQSKQIIEAHGGKIEVVSTVNKGSEFTVWLPKMHAAA